MDLRLHLSGKWYTIMLFIVMALAVALRLAGIWFGLPFPYHVDEPTYVSAALNLGAGRIGRQLNPPVLPNLLFLEYGVLYVIQRLGGIITSVADFERLYRTDPSMFFLLGRATSAVVGMLNVWVVYWMGCRSSNRSAGLLGALFLAVSFLHVRDSHFAVPDVLMTLLVSLSVLLCFRALGGSDRKSLWGAAFFSGMAVASKWSAWPVLIPLAFVLLQREQNALRDHTSGDQRIFLAVSTSAVVLIGFFLPGFQLLMEPCSYLAYALSELRSGDAGGFGIWQIDTVPGFIFYFKTLWIGLGGILFTFGVAGLIRNLYLGIFSRSSARILLFLFPLVYFAVMGSTRHYFVRYALPMIPFLVLFAGEFLIWLSRWTAVKWKKAGGMVVLILGLGAIIQPFSNSLRFDILMTRTDTRTMARAWIEDNIPAGSKIAMDWPIHTPVLSSEKYVIETEGGQGLAGRTLDYYVQEEFDYLIASSNIYEIPLVDAEMNADRQAFYSTLDSNTELIKQFYPAEDEAGIPFVFDEIYAPYISLWERDRPGPELKVYSVRD